jgi:hypothetical protein
MNCLDLNHKVSEGKWGIGVDLDKGAIVISTYHHPNFSELALYDINEKLIRNLANMFLRVYFEMTDKKGKFVGFDIDMAKEMAKAMGVKFVPVNTAWDGIIPSLITKKFDIIMSGMTVTQERNLKINFAAPYIIIGQTILLNKKHEGKIQSYKDLNDSKYIVTSKLGTTGEQVGGKAVAECVGADRGIDSRAACVAFHQTPELNAIEGAAGTTEEGFLGQRGLFWQLLWAELLQVDLQSRDGAFSERDDALLAALSLAAHLPRRDIDIAEPHAADLAGTATGGVQHLEHCLITLPKRIRIKEAEQAAP